MDKNGSPKSSDIEIACVCQIIAALEGGVTGGLMSKWQKKTRIDFIMPSLGRRIKYCA